MQKKFLWSFLFVSIGVLSLGTPAQAQDVPALSKPMFVFYSNTVGDMLQVPTLVNPSGFEFTASADHNVIDLGVPKVTKYTADIYAVGSLVTPVKTLDLGKPTPVNNIISWLQLATLRATMTAGDYVVKVTTEGPGGRNPSPLSDPFTLALTVPGAPGKPASR